MYRNPLLEREAAMREIAAGSQEQAIRVAEENDNEALMEQIDALEAEYQKQRLNILSLPPLQRLEAGGAIHQQYLDSLYGLPEVKMRGFYEDYRELLAEKFDAEQLEVIADFEPVCYVEDFDGRKCEIRCTSLEKYGLGFMRIINHDRNFDLINKVGIEGKKERLEAYISGVELEEIIVVDKASGKAVDLGRRLPCTVDIIREKSKADIEERGVFEDPADATGGNVHRLASTNYYSGSQVLVRGGSYVVRPKDYKTVSYDPDKEDEQALVTLLHEIGHSWDMAADPNRLFDVGLNQFGNNAYWQRMASKERNAWAWALRELRSWQKAGFALSAEALVAAEQQAEVALLSYDLNPSYIQGQSEEQQLFFGNLVRKRDYLQDKQVAIYDQFKRLVQEGGNEYGMIDLLGGHFGEGYIREMNDKVSVYLRQYSASGGEVKEDTFILNGDDFAHSAQLLDENRQVIAGTILVSNREIVSDNLKQMVITYQSGDNQKGLELYLAEEKRVASMQASVELFESLLASMRADG